MISDDELAAYQTRLDGADFSDGPALLEVGEEMLTRLDEVRTELEGHKRHGAVMDKTVRQLRARVAELEAQRDKVLALCEEIECSNCGHAVKLHDASPTGECTQDHMKTRACGCDWSHPIADDIRAVYADPAPAEPTADQQARDEADLADINRRVAAERDVLDKAKAWRAALPWQTGVPRDKHAERLADAQDALCTAVDALPANSHVAPTNSQEWEQAAAEGERRIAASAPLIGALVDGTFLPGPLAMRAETPAVDGLLAEREGGA